MRSIDEIVKFIERACAQGKSIVETIKWVRSEFKMDLAEAKLIVTSQPCWATVVDNSEQLHNEAIEMVEETSRRSQI